MELMNKVGIFGSCDILLLFTYEFNKILIGEYVKASHLPGWKKLQFLLIQRLEAGQDIRYISQFELTQL